MSRVVNFSTYNALSKIEIERWFLNYRQDMKFRTFLSLSLLIIILFINIVNQFILFTSESFVIEMAITFIFHNF